MPDSHNPPSRRRVLASAAAPPGLAGNLWPRDDDPTPAGTVDIPEGAVGFPFGETAVFPDDQGTELAVTLSGTLL